jgi:hypothetical protein
MINYHLIKNNKNSEQNVTQNIFTLNEDQPTNFLTLINDQVQNIPKPQQDINIFNDITFQSNNKAQEEEDIGNIIVIKTNDKIDNNQPRKNYFEVVYPQININGKKNCDLFSVKRKREKNGSRMKSINLAKNCLYENCMLNTKFVYKDMFSLCGIVGFDLKFSIKDKMGHSYASNRNFFRMKIKYIFCDSAPNACNNKDQYKANKRQRLDNILQEEMDNPNQNIKVINAMFNLYFTDFFFAYLNDESKIIVKNNSNGQTKVYFYKKIDLENIKEPAYIFDFNTYKKCLNDKYSKKLKKEFKNEMIDLLLGKKNGRSRKKNN